MNISLACYNKLMSSSPLISVLIPIYNASAYLEQCLKSITNQTLTSLEIICLNDGSTDHSLEIIKTYAAKDPRIIIIDKPNTGYGDSMNLGLERATGKYITIVEPDDWIDVSGLEKMYHAAQRYDAEVVKANHFSFRHTKSGNLIERKSSYISAGHPEVIHPKDYPRVFQFPPTIWAGLYRRIFIRQHQINFLPSPGASYQDIGFNLKVWLSNPKTVLLPDAFLHYQLDNSSSSVNNPGKINCVVDEYQAVWDYLKQHHLEHDFAAILAASQFRNYLWNLQRLSGSSAQKFYQTFRQTFQKFAELGYLNPEFFSALHWRILKAMLKTPRAAYLVIRLRAILRR